MASQPSRQDLQRRSRPSSRTFGSSAEREALSSTAEETATMTPPLLFPTTVVGSMPRPQYLKDLFASGSRTGAHDDRWQRRMDDAVRHIIGMQEQAGIDIVSDGEWRRESYVDVVAE